jgi:hypothetical protein
MFPGQTKLTKIGTRTGSSFPMLNFSLPLDISPFSNVVISFDPALSLLLECISVVGMFVRFFDRRFRLSVPIFVL